MQKINNSMLRLRGYISAGFFRGDVLFLQGKPSCHPSWVGKWLPASAGKAKAGMVHSVSGCAPGVHAKLWDLLRTHAIPERLRGVFTTRRYTNPCLPLPYLKHGGFRPIVTSA